MITWAAVLLVINAVGVKSWYDKSDKDPDRHNNTTAASLRGQALRKDRGGESNERAAPKHLFENMRRADSKTGTPSQKKHRRNHARDKWHLHPSGGKSGTVDCEERETPNNVSRKKWRLGIVAERFNDVIRAYWYKRPICAFALLPSPEKWASLEKSFSPSWYYQLVIHTIRGEEPVYK